MKADSISSTRSLLSHVDSLDPHPLGIKPVGNAYTASHNLKTSAGMFSCLPDELWVSVFECLDHHALYKIGLTCKAIFAFSTFDDLWKTICIK